MKVALERGADVTILQIARYPAHLLHLQNKRLDQDEPGLYAELITGDLCTMCPGQIWVRRESQEIEAAPIFGARHRNCSSPKKKKLIGLEAGSKYDIL